VVNLPIVALAGLVAGAIHVLSGPDHLAAVAPLAADSREPRWKSGFNWGMGHTSGVLVVGALALLLREVLPLDAISSWSERLVGAALVGVGLWGCHRALSTRVHTHEHSHDGSTHAHVHVHTPSGGRAAAHTAGVAHGHSHAAFAFGILHGLAGSSHLIGILPALALPTRSASVAYLLSYGVGNVGAMTAFTTAVGAVAGRAEAVGVPLHRGLLSVCSVAALLVGTVWLLA
jgi:ABC-type nickel/cobalt efflux system permease component RcnA